METVYCRICQCKYKLRELKRFTERDFLELLCPGCDEHCP